jgi:signal transduction histidine kinase
MKSAQAPQRGGVLSRPGNKRTDIPDAVERDRLGALSSIMNVGVLLLERSGALEFASPMAVRLFGCDSPEALQQRWGEFKGLIHLGGADSPSPPAAPLRGVIEVPAGGVVRSLRLEIHPLEGESCPGQLVLVKDRRAVDMLETDLVLASQMRSLVHVYRVMAHDLKAPLNSIQLTLELLADSLSDEDPFTAPSGPRERRQRHVSILREELSRLNRALQSMLDPGDPLGTVLQAFDLREVAREIARLLTPQARRQRVEFELQLPDGEVKVTGYRDRLKQALINLALNGLDAMAGGGRLTMGVARAETARIWVQDSGNGVPEGLVEEVYQSHFTREKSRAGVRLYVARLVIESHGGEMTVGSEPGRGTRFDLSLPLAVAAAPDATAPAGARPL